MIETLPPMTASEVLDYLIDATGLLEDGETLAEVGSSITVTGATKDSQDFEDDGVTVWLSGAAAGTPIRLTAILKTSGGRTFNRVYVIPFGEPVSLEMAKAQIGLLDDDSRDDLIADYITAAREYVEAYTGTILVPREVTESRDAFAPFFELRWAPFDPETVEISYTDTDNVGQSVSEVTVNGSRVRPGFNAWWPSVRYGTGVTITYTAGYAPEAVPVRLKQAILLLVAHWFEFRSAGSERTNSEAPFAVSALCDQFRRPGL